MVLIPTPVATADVVPPPDCRDDRDAPLPTGVDIHIAHRCGGPWTVAIAAWHPGLGAYVYPEPARNQAELQPFVDYVLAVSQVDETAITRRYPAPDWLKRRVVF